MSPATTEILVAAAHANVSLVALVNDAQTAIAALAEQSVAPAAESSPRQAVQTLIEHGGRTRNARLIDLAGVQTQRHQDTLDDGAALLASVKDLQQQYGTPGAPLLGSRPGARTNGSLSVRAM